MSVQKATMRPSGETRLLVRYACPVCGYRQSALMTRTSTRRKSWLCHNCKMRFIVDGETLAKYAGDEREAGDGNDEG